MADSSAPPHGHGVPHAGGSGAHGPGVPAAKETRLANLKTNTAYLALGNKAASKPGSVATRSVLTTFRYVLRYMLRRMFRVAKYAAIGGAIALVGTGVLGALGTGIAWFAAPSMGMGIGMGITWAIIKFTWRHRPERFRGGWWSEMAERAFEGRDPAKDEQADSEAVEKAV
ncbi:hypothetical protein CspeluHIS016_0103230 [Cutaneotrichosporon spelunceum]|uniref:Transmembrane protein n=1 Tax=Cutaneotrichosporon spelunceum TaxID=1672016 RepID=A0AAD3Y9F2_9TREE|nr:hypothetical protein CspeluHIS016_0103230 [Cutaneotrichosporon spelunceum]